MNAALDKWQQKLEVHFGALADERRNSGLPVFAIEHELDETNFTDISAGLHMQLARGESLAAHWLLWVVYATELGYAYDGEEYWPSFEQRTPYWRLEVDRRRQLRQWFIKFHTKYAGLKPSGSWATQFSIIAWPITHAILPKDLQTHLAKILYEQRYALAEVIDSAPVQVGRLVVACAYDSSSRLRNFLEQEELAGRIVLALLGSHQELALGSILDGTIRRIISDLETTRDAKNWLKEARSTVASVKVRLAAKSLNDTEGDAHGTHSSGRTEGSEDRTIRPRLALIRNAPHSWTATLELPSFVGVASLNARFATFLRTTRCMVATTGPAWNPKGWLLYGTQRRRLISWPDPSKPVVRFEQWDEAIFHLLQADCQISQGPIWLFRVNNDGTASEVVGRHVRPGYEYILLHTTVLTYHPLLKASSVSCEGVLATEVSIPIDVSEDILSTLARIGLRLERTFRIWPVGLPATHWDGEGRIDWFTGESLCIGLAHDGSCEEIALNFDEQRESTVIAVQANPTTFLSLGQLSAGSHMLTVTATYRNPVIDKGIYRVNAKATLSIFVRAPNRWIPGTSGHAGLIVTTEPHEPTLVGLLDGRVQVAIAGPEGRTVACGVELLDAAGKVLAFEALGDIRIPMATADWGRIIDARARRGNDPSHYLRASGGRLVIDAGELGCTRIALSHTVVPMRWLAQNGKNIELQLVDDTAHTESIKVEFANFSEPSAPSELVLEDLSRLIRPTGHGGLFLAVAGGHRAGVVVSVPGRLGLQELADRPKLNFMLRNGDAVATLLCWIRDWSKARIVGPLAAQRRAFAVRGMEDQLFATMCWVDWIHAERRYRDRDASVANAEQWLENAVDRQVSFALGMSQTRDKVLSESIEDSAQSLLGLAIRFRVCGDLKLCEAALRLGATPALFTDWAGSGIVNVLDELVRLQPLLRGVRMLVLLCGDEGKRRAERWMT